MWQAEYCPPKCPGPGPRDLGWLPYTAKGTADVTETKGLEMGDTIPDPLVGPQYDPKGTCKREVDGDGTTEGGHATLVKHNGLLPAWQAEGRQGCSSGGGEGRAAGSARSSWGVRSCWQCGFIPVGPAWTSGLQR